jgi:signal transduction histidine kinase
LNQVKDISSLLAEIEELKSQLFEANNIIDAIKEGSVDALVLNREGRPTVYSLESADYTYRILIEKFGEGALSISEDGLVLYCNEYFASMMGAPTNKIIGTYFNSYVDSVGRFQLLKSALVNGPSKGEIVLNFNGKKLPVYASLTDLSPSIPAIGIIVTDLTEKRKHEEALAVYQKRLEAKINELNQINTSLEEFIHVISHDIKEPIRKILIYSDHLHSDRHTLFGKEDLKHLNTIKSSALRLNSLVDDLVKYSVNTSPTELEEIDLGEVLQEVKEDMVILIEENGATIKHGVLPKIRCSHVQMRQLFSNLIGNAIKYKKKNESPVITITAEITSSVDPQASSKEFYKLSVRDNGIGMGNSTLNKIFVMFQRLHMRNEYSGNGIGLAICKKIMENHSGKIEVESSPNDGSTFNLYFPIPAVQEKD